MNETNHVVRLQDTNTGLRARLSAKDAEIATLRKALKAAKPIVQNFYDGNEKTYDLVCAALEMSGGVK